MDLGAEYGLGKRARKNVNYFEEFTDTQFAKIIEKGGDVNANLESFRKRKRNEGNPGDGDGDEDEDDLSPPTKRQKKQSDEESIVQSEASPNANDQEDNKKSFKVMINTEESMENGS